MCAGLHEGGGVKDPPPSAKIRTAAKTAGHHFSLAPRPNVNLNAHLTTF